MTQNKTARWLDLLAYLLQHRFPVTREQIFADVAGYQDGADPKDQTAFETTRRKFERDKDELRELGIELQTVDIPGAEGDEPAKGYRLAPRDLYLPYLELREAGERGGGAAAGKPYQLREIRVTKGDVRRLDEATQRVAATQSAGDRRVPRTISTRAVGRLRARASSRVTSLDGRARHRTWRNP